MPEKKKSFMLSTRLNQQLAWLVYWMWRKNKSIPLMPSDQEAFCLLDWMVEHRAIQRDIKHRKWRIQNTDIPEDLSQMSLRFEIRYDHQWRRLKSQSIWFNHLLKKRAKNIHLGSSYVVSNR
jgi:hypothetical protein